MITRALIKFARKEQPENVFNRETERQRDRDRDRDRDRERYTIYTN